MPLRNFARPDFQRFNDEDDHRDESFVDSDISAEESAAEGLYTESQKPSIFATWPTPPPAINSPEYKELAKKHLPDFFDRAEWLSKQRKSLKLLVPPTTYMNGPTKTFRIAYYPQWYTPESQIVRRE